MQDQGSCVRTRLRRDRFTYLQSSSRGFRLTRVRVSRLAETILTDFEAKQELDRLLADPQLELPQRARASLSYLAEAMFNGEARADTYAMARSLYGRGPKFDPLLDPIVRIEIARLRRALERYYDAHGAALGAEIIIPHGTYIPRFVATGAQTDAPNSDESPGGQFSNAGNTEHLISEITLCAPPRMSAGQFADQLLFYLSVAGALIVTMVGFILAVSILFRS